MKQVPKTQQVVDRMRAAFGPDVDVQKLAVYEASILNTQPLRKSGGIFKGARVTPATLTQIVNSINTESAPIRLEHAEEGDAPFGRAFYAEVVDGDDLRALYTVDDATMASKIDNGTLDQTSVNFMPLAITCSACGFNFIGSDATFENLMSGTCGEGHVMNEGGVFPYVDGLAAFHELSMVGKGAARGARIVGPSESRLAAGNDNYRRLAAKAGFSGIALTCEAIEESNVDITAQLTAAVEAKTEFKLKAEAAEAKVTTLEASVADLTTKLAAATDAKVAEKLTAAEADVTKAVAALTDELKVILTALDKPLENLPTDVAGLVAAIGEHRAAFAAVIPVGGKTKPLSEGPKDTPAPARTAAFSTRR